MRISPKGPSRAVRRAGTPLALTGLLVWLLSGPPSGAQESDPAPPDDTPAAGPGARTQWLDEVRAQRQAWETRREETRKALDARHRWIDPWGAAQHEARQREIDQRRQVSRERIEQEREQFRAWRPPFATLPEPLPPPPPPWSPGLPPSAEPPGWDNLWYYQGY